ncbi:OLC1v1035375C1 [Oldenlandia corymbosa var. corymbosa]|uniref:OLC1v1035375C1 n=1 Tax=Oldenlandia corymbosa var. corymbosa TaxID=529605 RepID=A0AAV1CTK5_OLDCO|nr:OLC1v1035375C1 [Oldenlandia corymbosa var. corymbosa]
MRAGLSTIQQTLTPEAASVLNHSIAEAGRRNHGQTTPLHVAATLLASPSGYLRQACIRSHPNSSHPLQCRALELCFSVALERLPTAQNMAPGMEPPISNALMAALKRAQAHQRRGCPEQQQQPLLAVKVELEQLIISILDDPSVSRVMREASFSSPAVKATIEQSLNSSSNTSSNAIPHGNVNLGTFGGISGPRLLTPPTSIPVPTPNLAPVMTMPNRNMYLNRRLMEGGSGQLGSQRNEEVKKVVDILMRTKKRNPILVGEAEPEAVVKELVQKIEKGELGNDGLFKNVAVVSVEKELGSDKNQMVEKIKELEALVESRMSGNGSGGVILDLGDLKWLVEQPGNFGGSGGGQQQQQVVSEAGKVAVAEMGKLLSSFGENGIRGKCWLIGTATCETYLRCQVYHPTMETDWDLQAVPITSRSPMPGMFSRPGAERILGNSTDPLNSLKKMPLLNPALSRAASEKVDPARKISCCPQCLEKYEQELTLMRKELENSSPDKKSEPAPAQTSLPQWLQNAKLGNGAVKLTDMSQKDPELLAKQKTQALQRKWNDTCLRLHPSFHQSVNPERSSPALPTMSLCNPKLLLHQPIPSKLPTTRILGNTLQLTQNEGAVQPLDRVSAPNQSIIPPLGGRSTPTEVVIQPKDRAGTPPRSPVRTELALGRKANETTPEKATETGEEQVKDLLSRLCSAPQMKLVEKFASALDADSFKKLLKGLMEKAWWQQEAASAVASAVTRCRLGNGKQRGGASKGDVWLLFTGPDRIAKRKMASVLSEQMSGVNPIMIPLGSRRDDAGRNTIFRGKTALDRIVEAVRMNPFSVIVLEDVDEADMLMRGNIKRAMERGRITDSHGREISLGNVIFILTGNWSSISNAEASVDEKKFASLASGNWQLKLRMSEKNAKRRISWLQDADRPTRPRIQASSGLSFDLNLAADGEDDRTDGSHNSSDLTVDHEDEHGLETGQFTTSVPHELFNLADDAIVFKPVSLAFVRSEIKKTIATKFSIVLDDRASIQVDEEAVERIVGGLWHGRSGLGEWVEKALTPSFEQLSSRLPSTMTASKVAHLQLELDSTLDNKAGGELLPSSVAVMVDGV